MLRLFLSTLTLGLALIPGILASPIEKRSGPWEIIDSNFPDPSFIQAANGSWYAFGTNGNGKHVQVAHSDDFQTWTLLDVDALPTPAGWQTEVDVWAPDVIQRDDGKYVLYYSGEAKSDLRHHCVGAAISQSTNPEGPYIAQPNPISCRLNQGGSIDSGIFIDTDGKRYVVFKVDGNSVGHGGDCNNGIPPLVPTPILLQQVADDGVTLIGDAVQILDRDDSDGPLVEAPSLIFHEGVYFLFYSTHCFTDPLYDVRYATASNVAGPYKKTGGQLLKGGQFGLRSPGSATVSGRGDRMLFHAFCADDVRCAYAADLSIQGDQVGIV